MTIFDGAQHMRDLLHQTDKIAKNKKERRARVIEMMKDVELPAGMLAARSLPRRRK